MFEASGSTRQYQRTENSFPHLKSFAEHVFPFLTPKQVDDHLFAIQPSQCGEVSGQNTIQSHNRHC